MGEEMNKELMRAAGFVSQVERFEEGKCLFCGKLVCRSSFRDEIGRKEFKISGLCQSCQDGVFGTGGKE